MICGRVARLFVFSLPVPELWVPRACVVCKGGWRCCRYYVLRHATRLASDLRRSSPALYYLLVLSAIAVSEHRVQPGPLHLDSGTDTRTLSLSGRGICRHAGIHPPAHHRTRDWNSVDGDASVKTALGPRLVAEEKAGGASGACFPTRACARLSGRRASTISTCGRQRSVWRS